MERSRDWFDQAEGDLRHARSDLDAAEAWGHAVADLLMELSRRHAVPNTLIDGALELDKAYVATRDPNAHPAGSPRTRYTKGEATRLIDYADEILRFCADLLPRLR